MTNLANDPQAGQASVQISQLLVCPKCGYANAASTRHCDGCGASLAGVTATAPREPVPARKRGLLDRLRHK